MNMKELVQGFFDLSLEEKNKFAKSAGGVEGYGQAFVISEEQTLDWADGLLLITSPLNFRSLKFWPTNPKPFRFVVA